MCGCFRDVKLITKSNNDNSEYKYLSYESNDVDDFPDQNLFRTKTRLFHQSILLKIITLISHLSLSEEYFLIEKISNNQIIYKHPITGHLFKYTSLSQK